MYSLKYCHEFQKIYKEYSFDQNPLKLACVFLKNEAFIVDGNDDAWHFLNKRPRKLADLCKKGVKQFSYCYNTVGDVVCYYECVLIENGDIYGWGEDSYSLISDKKENDFYKLLKKNFEQHPKFEMFYKQIKFDTIAIGQRHCMGITKHNRLVLWGDNTHGQLGNESIEYTKPFNMFEVHKENQTIIKTKTYLRPRISCLNNSFLISFFGSDTNEKFFYKKCTRKVEVDIPGELVAQNQVIHHQPRINVVDRSHDGYKIKQIACGSYHSLVLLNCCDLYGFGSNSSGQLGLIPQTSRKQPTVILQQIDQVVTTAIHTLALTFDKRLFAMGDNSYAQLGSIKPDSSSIPLEINLKVVEISTINGLSLAKDENGLLYCWGYWGNESENFISNTNTNNQEMIEENNSENSLQSNQPINNTDSVIHVVEVSTANSNPNAVIGEPKRVYCTTFAEVVAKRFSITHYTISGKDFIEPVNEKPYLIDPESVSVLKDDAEREAENLVKRVTFNNQDIEVLKGRVEIVERKPNINIGHLGDKIRCSLFDGLVVTDISPTINISNSSVAGKMG